MMAEEMNQRGFTEVNLQLIVGKLNTPLLRKKQTILAIPHIRYFYKPSPKLFGSYIKRF